MARAPRQKKPKVPDSNLALIAVILGATSFVMSVFTGIPAIIVGIIALRKGAGNRVQAWLGITFGIISAALLILLVWLLGFHFFHSPLSQEFSVPSSDEKRMTTTINALKTYKHEHGDYPMCGSDETAATCSDWQRFIADNPGLIKNPIVLENDATAVPSQPVGTIVYVTQAACFVNTPTLPSYLQDKDDPGSGPPNDTVAIVYYYAKGHACYSTDQHYN